MINKEGLELKFYFKFIKNLILTVHDCNQYRYFLVNLFFY